MLNRFQFTRLRPLKRPQAPATQEPRDTPVGKTRRQSGSARVLCVASGKGGTGKSVMASKPGRLPGAHGGKGPSWWIFDAGLANAHLLLGLAPDFDLGHVMEGRISARDAPGGKGPLGMKLLSGGVGRDALVNPTRRELDRLFKALRPMEDMFDLIIIDHGAGLGYSTVAHLAATSTLILVTNHEVTALSDGYALYKRAMMVNPSMRVGLVVNRAPDERLAQAGWDRFRTASQRFLGSQPEFIGWVPQDPEVGHSVQARRPITISKPGNQAAQAIARIAQWTPIDHAPVHKCILRASSQVVALSCVTLGADSVRSTLPRPPSFARFGRCTLVVAATL